jgi:hypothetical protein
MPSRFADRVAALPARIASSLGPLAMRTIARFNKRVTDPIQRLWAHRLPYMAVIEHKGTASQSRPPRTSIRQVGPLLRVIDVDDDGVIGVDEDQGMRTAPLGVVSGAVVGVVTGCSSA